MIMQEKDTTATHFIANKRDRNNGYAITLYRFRRLPKCGQTECKCTPELKARGSICHFCISESSGERPQYLGPLGWQFHSSVKDKDVIPKLLPIEKLEEVTGDNLEKYLFVNNKIRQENNKKIMELCRNSTSEQLWQGRFTRMSRSSNRAGFADHRTYFHNGKEVDRQVHLGVDLASTRHAKVEAANKGKVIYADYLGIYGNMVILDHGLGVFSLYSHLSDIAVAKGDLVEKGSSLGSTGTTGMAGGDHLHFSMLVNGILVNPLEWWDESWLNIHILSYLK